MSRVSDTVSNARDAHRKQSINRGSNVPPARRWGGVEPVCMLLPKRSILFYLN